MTQHPQLTLAWELADNKHRGQAYGNQPYMYHLEAVSHSLNRETDDRLPVIGLLHDILEDTNCTENVLRLLFEKAIVDAVVAVTKVDGESYEAYIVRVKGNALARVVKMHDTICNLEESLVRRDMKRVIKYSKQLQFLAE